MTTVNLDNPLDVSDPGADSAALKTLFQAAACVFDDHDAVVADTHSTRPTGQTLIALKEGSLYTVAASGAADHDYTTAGGVKLYLTREGYAADRYGFGLSAVMADDTATTFAVPATAGIVDVFAAQSRTGNLSYSLRAGSASALTARSNNGLTVTTGVLAGTTGSDGAFTVAMHHDGQLYAENRLGSTVTCRVIFFY